MADDTVRAFHHLEAVPEADSGESPSEFANVQSYLDRFGYLSDQEFAIGELDRATERGLERFQRFYDIPATGAFDEATRHAMMQPRCALPDPMESDVEFATTCAWTDHSLTYALDTGTSDVSRTAEWDAIRRAFQTWADLDRLTFSEVGTGTGHDVRVGWRPEADPDYSMVGGTLAHADLPPGCGVVTNTLPKPVRFDDSEHVWSIGVAVGAFDIETVALHEIGHIVGLAHSSVAGAVMAPTVSSNSTKRSLTQDDIDGYLDLYPSSPGGTVSLAGVYHLLR